nr:hypothetical protein [Pseudomonas oryzagri]
MTLLQLSRRTLNEKMPRREISRGSLSEMKRAE